LHERTARIADTRVPQAIPALLWTNRFTKN
jgi:hypothetical protein